MIFKLKNRTEPKHIVVAKVRPKTSKNMHLRPFTPLGLNYLEDGKSFGVTENTCKVNEMWSQSEFKNKTIFIENKLEKPKRLRTRKYK